MRLMSRLYMKHTVDSRTSLRACVGGEMLNNLNMRSKRRETLAVVK